MQSYPYIHEMKERLLSQGSNPDQLLLEAMDRDILEIHGDSAVGTVVKLNPDGYGSHTSPTHCSQQQPLMADHGGGYYDDFTPKNAKTSLFIIMSFVYAKLLIVICIAFVISEVVTHNLPLQYYEGFFTYLYGASILFLLYVFCFLLQESACCNSGPDPPKKAKKKEVKKKKEKEKEKDKDKDKDKDKKKKNEKPTSAPPPPPPPEGGAGQKGAPFQKEKYPRKMKDLLKLKKANQPPTNESLPIESNETDCDIDEGVLRTLRTSKDVNLNDGSGDSPSQEKLTGGDSDVEGGGRQWKRKTTQNLYSHGSFFLRVGAIGFGLCTMIYNGLECGAFFEIPFTSPCYQILRGINPLLQMVFTFMQMYFIFMNSRLNIHRFKVVARFGLMHIVATNLCVWIRTLVLESLKEIKAYQYRRLGEALSTVEEVNVLDFMKVSPGHPRDIPILSTSTMNPTTLTSTLITAATTIPTVPTLRAYYTKAAKSATRSMMRLTTSTVKSTLPTIATLSTETTTPSTTTTTAATTAAFNAYPAFYDASDFPRAVSNATSVLYNAGAPIFPAALTSSFSNATSAAAVDQACGRVNIMGSIVEDSAPYLFPSIIEYSLIGAAVMFVMWRHIGHNPRYVSEEDLERRLEMMLSRRAVAMARAQHGRVDCVGASKGLFFGLLLLVGSLICLILFFVLIQHPKLGLVAIYLADVSHCVVMVLSVIAIIVGFIRVQSLKFRAEEQSDLNDILLRVSAFGLFIYAVFSIIAGSLSAFTKEPNLLVMITGILSVLQVVLQLLFIADVARRRVHLPEHDRSKPGRQVVTFLLICNVTMWIIYTFEMQKVIANPVQLDFYGILAWAIVQRVTLPLCIFHRFHSAVTLAEIWKTSYKARLE